MLALLFVCLGAMQGQVVPLATFGQVITLGGTPSDMVLDEPRRLLYLVNNAGNRVDVLSAASNTVIASIPVGIAPLAAAMSMDGAYLYVTNGGDITVSVIDLNARLVAQTVSLPAGSVPQGIEVGSDGRALVSISGTASLIIIDRTQPAGAQLTAVVSPPTPSTPTPAPTSGLVVPDTKFLSKLVRTPNGQYIVGLNSPTTNTTTLFVYEVSSGTILRNRNVTGQSTVLSMSPDGSRFMAGYTLYDVATLSVLGQMSNANAPFPFTQTFSVRQGIGGSVFSPDGKTIYGAFNTAPFTAATAPSNSFVLLLSDPNNLAIRLGIRLPESIVAKMVLTSDGANAWSLSQSGLIYLPLSTLYSYPIIAPSSTQVFMSQNPCNPGLAQANLTVNNLGAGKLTYAVTTISAALTSSVTSGVAPSNITFTMEPGRLAVVRQAGTNLATGLATLSGQPLDVALYSPEAINIPPSVRVYMNFRNADQRGVIFPIPVTQNNSANVGLVTTNGALIAGDQGLEDIVLDQPRNRVYITNAGFNRIEVFDTVNQVFLTPIAVGQLPHQMAMATDGNTLYVGNTGGELIDIVDLNLGRDVGHIAFPPLSRQAGGVNYALLFPQALAVGSAGLEFVMSNGGQWKVVGGVAVPRPLDPLTKTTANTNALPTPVSMLASPDNAYIVTLTGTGITYLYQASTDSYISQAAPYSAAIQGFFGPLSASTGGSYFTLGGLYTNPALTVLGGVANATAASRNTVATVPYDAANFLRLSSPVRTAIGTAPTTDPRVTLELVSIANGSTRQVAVAPDNPRVTLIGVNRLNLPPRSMVVDNNGVAYFISLSGLSVVPLTPNGAATPAIATGARAIVSADGTTTLKVGGVINVTGTNLAGTAAAQTLPPPTVLGGSCITFNDVALPLLQTSSGQLQAQIPPTVNPGTNVVQVRSLATGQQSAPVVVTVLTAAGGSGGSGGTSAVDQGRGNNRIAPKGR